jgi:hypothetical protein
MVEEEEVGVSSLSMDWISISCSGGREEGRSMCLFLLLPTVGRELAANVLYVSDYIHRYIDDSSSSDMEASPAAIAREEARAARLAREADRLEEEKEKRRAEEKRRRRLALERGVGG